MSLYACAMTPHQGRVHVGPKWDGLLEPKCKTHPPSMLVHLDNKPAISLF